MIQSKSDEQPGAVIEQAEEINRCDQIGIRIS